MSHTTRIKAVVITDIAALEAAVNDLNEAGINCTLKENATPRMYFANQSGVCDYVLSLTATKYDVGFEKQADGGYVPIFDVHANYVGSQLGATCPMPKSEEGRAQHAIAKLMSSYSKHAAINAAMSQGYFVESDFIDADGNHQLVFASY